MYAESVKIRAYTLFISPGESPEEIARILKADHPRITAKTIRKWAETPDQDGMTWEDRRSSIQTEVRRSLDEQAVSTRARMKGRLETVLQKLYDDLHNEKLTPKFKTLEGAAHAIKSVAQFLVQLEDQEQDRWSSVMAAQVIMEIFTEIPEVRRVVEKHWTTIWKQIQSRLDHNSNSKEITGEVIS